MTTKEHLTKHDREIAEIWPLMGKLAKGALAAQDEIRELRANVIHMQTGIVEMQATIREMRDAIRDLAIAQKRTEEKLRELAAAQKRTETALQTFISRTTPRNGHTKRKIDLQ